MSEPSNAPKHQHPQDPPSVAPGLTDSVLVLLGTLLGLAVSPWVLGQFSFETHKDLVRGAVDERRAVEAFDAQTDARLALYDRLAEAGGDSAAEVERTEYSAAREAERRPLVDAMNEQLATRETLLSRLRWGGLILVFGSIAITLPAQLGVAIPKKTVWVAGLVASLAGAVWMVCFIGDPNAGNGFHRLMAAVIGFGVGGWGLWTKFAGRASAPSSPTTV